MTLPQQNWIGFDGLPITGRTLPSLQVYSEPGRELSQQQRGAVAHAFKLFTDAVRASAIPDGFHIQHRSLEDGTKVQLNAMLGNFIVKVWPTGGGEERQLPHGFAVQTNWASPKIFKRRPGATPLWATDPTALPQVRGGEPVDAENQVFRATSSGSFFNHPMVLDKTPRALWDYLKHGAPTLTSTRPVVPIDLVIDGDPPTYSTRAVNYGIDNMVASETGATLYTMTLAPAILTSDPETPVYVPAATAADGSILALQHIRRAIISTTAGIFQLRFASEKIIRSAIAVYSAVERNVLTITSPIGGGGPPSGATTTDLDIAVGALDTPLTVASNRTGGTYSGYTYVDGFNYSVLDISSAAVLTQAGTREYGALAASPVTVYEKTILLAEDSRLWYPELRSAENATGDVLWRAGFKKSYADWNSSPISGTRWFGIYGLKKERINSIYNRQTSPEIKFHLGWTALKLFNGSSDSTCVGELYTDTINSGRSLAWWDGFYFAQDYILFSNFTPIGNATVDIAALNSGQRKPEVVALVSQYPPQTSSLNERSEIISDVSPVNTGNYAYTSRYVIDFDHKGRFLACIRVDVECAGAEWRQGGVFRGNMVEYAKPSYAVKIYLETNWSGAVAATLLATGNAVRSGFEFVVVGRGNPYTALFPGLPDEQHVMKVRVPPSPGLPMDATTQFVNICANQGVNTHLACADVRPDITGDAAIAAQSTAGIEFSTIKAGRVTPHKKYVTGQLYARTFKLSDLPDALWLLRTTRCDARENDGITGPDWFYMPALKTTIDNTVFHIEVRDGVHELWSNEFYPGPDQPAPADRDIKLYRI